MAVEAEVVIENGRFGRYQIITKLGEGMMGKVYRAYDTNLEREVALKILTRNRTSDLEAMKRFSREGKATAKLHHPHIVSMYDMGKVDGQPYLSMQFISGSPLNKYIEEKKISMRNACKIMVKVLGAMHYAHSEGFVHRDLKPANILLDTEKKPYVTDFGLVKSLTHNATQISREGAIMGTVAYMSPEQAHPDIDNAVDIRSDIYSLGAIFYEMLVGQPPFEGNTIYATLHKIVKEPLVSPKEINPQVPVILEDVCIKALYKNKEKRYQNTKEMAAKIQSYLQQSTSNVVADVVDDKPTKKNLPPIDESKLGKSKVREISVAPTRSTQMRIPSRSKSARSKRIKSHSKNAYAPVFIGCFIALFVFILFVANTSTPNSSKEKAPQYIKKSKIKKPTIKKKTTPKNNILEKNNTPKKVNEKISDRTVKIKIPKETKNSDKKPDNHIIRQPKNNQPRHDKKIVRKTPQKKSQDLHNMFVLMDGNQNNKISIDEWPDSKAKFAFADKDKNNSISKIELGKYLQSKFKAQQQKQLKPQVNDKKPDKKADQEDKEFDEELKLLDIKGIEFEADGKKVPPTVWFQKADVNKDRKISANEWNGDKNMFFVVDKDGDGFINVPELRAAILGQMQTEALRGRDLLFQRGRQIGIRQGK